jgi:sugar/nucleoside kinase (ribokinase family)
MRDVGCSGGAADAQCIFQSTVGKDAFGEFLRARLALCPGLQDAVTVHPEWPTGVCIVLSGAHDRAFVTQVCRPFAAETGLRRGACGACD